MTPLTEHEEVTKRTYNQLAKQWSTGHLTEDFWIKELELFKKLLPRGRVLEIGCGGGRDTKHLLKLGYEYLGTDIAGNLLKEARKRNPSAKFAKVSIYDLKFNKPFDGFWCSAVLLHVPKSRIDEALTAINACLKPNAAGFISIKKGVGEELERRIDLDGDGRLFSYWQDEDFRKVLVENGFKVLLAGYRPMSERSKWLTYHVRVVR